MIAKGASPRRYDCNRYPVRTEIQRQRRSLDMLQEGLVRPAVLVLLACVLWGTLIAAGFAWHTASDGLSAAIGAAVPAEGDAWGWVNLVTGLLAVIVWLFVAATALGRSGQPRSRRA